MKLIRYNHPLDQSINELANWFREPFTEFEPLSRVLGHRFRDLVSGDSRLAADLFDAGEAYVARFHLPGVAKDALKVNLEPNSELVVAFEREQSGDEGTELARATRRLVLPEDANADGVKAKLEDGVLTVTIEKTEARKPRTIAID